MANRTADQVRGQSGTSFPPRTQTVWECGRGRERNDTRLGSGPGGGLF